MKDKIKRKIFIGKRLKIKKMSIFGIFNRCCRLFCVWIFCDVYKIKY
jgi:hypothetical protein